jgi:hypothetical protein
VRLLLDEMFPHPIAVALVARHHDVVSIHGDRPQRRHRSDHEVLPAAQGEQRAVVTENAVDPLAVAAAVQADGAAQVERRVLRARANRRGRRDHPPVVRLARF